MLYLLYNHSKLVLDKWNILVKLQYPFLRVGCWRLLGNKLYRYIYILHKISGAYKYMCYIPWIWMTSVTEYMAKIRHFLLSEVTLMQIPWGSSFRICFTHHKASEKNVFEICFCYWILLNIAIDTIGTTRYTCSMLLLWYESTLKDLKFKNPLSNSITDTKLCRIYGGHMSTKERM